MVRQAKKKVENCIRMLQILSSGRRYKASDLAGLLDTKVRNIIEYRKLLEEVGYRFDNVSGKYGGYSLRRTDTIPSIKLEENEKKHL